MNLNRKMINYKIKKWKVLNILISSIKNARKTSIKINKEQKTMKNRANNDKKFPNQNYNKIFNIKYNKMNILKKIINKNKVILKKLKFLKFLCMILLNSTKTI